MLTGAVLYGQARDFAGYLRDANEGYARTALASVMGAHIGRAVATLNGRPPVAVSRPASTDGAWTNDVRRQLHGFETGLLRSLRGSRRSDTLVVAEELRVWAEGELLSGAVAAAELAARRAQSPTAAAAGVATAIDLGNSLRGLLRGIALAIEVRYRLVGGLGADAWLRSPKGRSVRASSTARSLEVGAMLDRRPRVGGYYSVIGTVADISIVHRDRKPYSSATLVDAAGREVVVAVPKMKIDSGGMSVGGAARVRGRWETDLRWVPGGKGLLVAFTPQEDAARTNWSSWLTIALRPVITPVPHSLDMQVSWDPGRSATGNLLTYGVWCSAAESGPLSRATPPSPTNSN